MEILQTWCIWFVDGLNCIWWKKNFATLGNELIIKKIYFLPSMTQLPEMDCHSWLIHCSHGDERKGSSRTMYQLHDLSGKVEEWSWIREKREKNVFSRSPAILFLYSNFCELDRDCKWWCFTHWMIVLLVDEDEWKINLPQTVDPDVSNRNVLINNVKVMARIMSSNSRPDLRRRVNMVTWRTRRLHFMTGIFGQLKLSIAKLSWTFFRGYLLLKFATIKFCLVTCLF